MERQRFASEKEIWWELDKKCIILHTMGKLQAADEIEGAMKHFKKPDHEECRKFFDRGY